MSDTRRNLWSLLQTIVVVLLATGVFAVVCLYLASSDMSLPTVFNFGSKQEGWRASYVARFRRHGDAAAVRGDTGPLRCSLAPWTGPALNGDAISDLRLELTNDSTEPIRLWHTGGPECHVTFTIRDQANMPMSSFCYGYLSPLPDSFDQKTGRPQPLPPVLTLEPGDTHTVGIRLQVVGDHCSGPSLSGDFQLEAVFLYDDLNGYPEADQHFVARSRPLPIRVVLLKGQGRPVWVMRSNMP